MKRLFLLSCIVLSSLSSTYALEKVVTIEGPVRVITSPSTPGTVAYWTEDAQHLKYKVILPELERGRFTSAIERDPTTLMRFDGTLVDDDAGRALNVTKWDAITTTTTVTDDQGKITTEKTTIYTK